MKKHQAGVRLCQYRGCSRIICPLRFLLDTLITKSWIYIPSISYKNGHQNTNSVQLLVAEIFAKKMGSKIETIFILPCSGPNSLNVAIGCSA